MTTRRFFVAIDRDASSDSSSDCEETRRELDETRRELGRVRGELSRVRGELAEALERPAADDERLARLLPQIYSLRVLRGGTLLYRGSASQYEADADYPPRYAAYSESVVLAAEGALVAGGQRPLLREFYPKRDLLLLNLDAMTYRGTYTNAEVAAARAAFEANDLAAGVDATARIVERVDRQSIDALAWLAAAAGDAFVSESRLIGILRAYRPEIDGFVRNTSAAGAREIIIANPRDALVRTRYRQFEAFEAAVIRDEMAGVPVSAVGITTDSTTGDTRGQQLALLWAAEPGARYRLLTDATTTTETNLRELIIDSIVDNRTNNPTYAGHRRFREAEALFMLAPYRPDVGLGLGRSVRRDELDARVWAAYPGQESTPKRKRSRARRRVN